MSIDTWGELPKSQIDPEKIEEAIERLIAAFDFLPQHKASEVIDHLVASIIADKVKDGELNIKKITANHNFIFSTFDSLDGWQKGGVGTETITVCVGGTKLETGGVLNDTAYIAAVPEVGMGDPPNFDDLPFAQALIKIMDKTKAEVHFHIGYYGFQKTGENYVGFYFYQSKVYAVCRQAVSGETKLEIIDAPEPENPHIYRIEYLSDVLVNFYIDGVLKKTITTNIPWGDTEQAAIFIGVKNSQNAGAQAIGVFHALYEEVYD